MGVGGGSNGTDPRAAFNLDSWTNNTAHCLAFASASLPGKNKRKELNSVQTLMSLRSRSSCTKRVTVLKRNEAYLDLVDTALCVPLRSPTPRSLWLKKVGLAGTNGSVWLDRRGEDTMTLIIM